jgi:hypothetical protein
MYGRGLDSSGARWSLVMGYCEHSNVSSGFIKIEGVLDQLSDYRLLKNNSTHGINWLSHSVMCTSLLKAKHCNISKTLVHVNKI